MIDRRTFIALLSSAAIAQLAQAQQTRVYRVGVILEGGPDYVTVDGLKAGLRDLGYEEASTTSW